ncbi:uncharacterized protein LOC133711010 [Rosa rugosa]|uniref:uncharacterized protein LOC133711010 n=1 Tax=Rosa rugosa TaxID=74645 RepID=UPI002B411573|nr:uncharacterized protein LOC133711010 [Rosa rugosa]
MSRRMCPGDSMEEDSGAELTVWVPKEFQLKRTRDNIVDSDQVSICAIPAVADIFSGKGVPSDALVLSPHHLRFLRFPLHPLFQIMWRILGLHPMQFNPNSYMLLAGLLVMGKKWEVSLGISDFLFCHRLAHIAETDWFFNFSPRPLRKVFEDRTCSFSGWKSEALMVQGEWAAPAIPTVIPKAFSKRAAYVPVSVDSLLDEERIAWIKQHLLCRKWSAVNFASKVDLEDVSKSRAGAIYSNCLQSLDPNLSGEELLQHVIELERKFFFTERTSALFAASLSTEEESEKRESVGMDIRRVKLPAPQGRKSFKKPKLIEGTTGSARGGFENVRGEADSSRGDKEASGIFPLLQTNLSNSPGKSASDHSAISLPDTHPVACPNVSSSNLKLPLQLLFPKGDDSYVLEGDPIAFDKEACLAVAQSLALNDADREKLSGLSMKDISAQLALGLQSSSSMVQHLMMRMEASELQLWKLIKEARDEAAANAIKLEETRVALEGKCKVADANDREVSELKTKLGNEIANRAKEFELNQNEIHKSSCKYYRLGWVQGQQIEKDRFFDEPDTFDAGMGVHSSEYDWIPGMDPADRPSEDDAEDTI